MSEQVRQEDVYRFALIHIDSVPHLEALLLIWNSRPRAWTKQELAANLFVPEEVVYSIVRDLGERQFIVPQGGGYGYAPGPEERERLMQGLSASYRENLIALTKLIHSKGTAAREFARAFRFRKERE